MFDTVEQELSEAHPVYGAKMNSPLPNQTLCYRLVRHQLLMQQLRLSILCW